MTYINYQNYYVNRKYLLDISNKYVSIPHLQEHHYQDIVQHIHLVKYTTWMEILTGACTNCLLHQTTKKKRQCHVICKMNKDEGRDLDERHTGCGRMLLPQHIVTSGLVQRTLLLAYN